MILLPAQGEPVQQLGPPLWKILSKLASFGSHTSFHLCSAHSSGHCTRMHTCSPLPMYTMLNMHTHMHVHTCMHNTYIHTPGHTCTCTCTRMDTGVHTHCIAGFSFILTVGSRSGPRGPQAACTLAPSHTDLSVTGHVLEAPRCSALEASLSLHTALPFPLNSLHVFLWTWGWCLQPRGFKGATWAQVTRAGRCSSPARKTSALGLLPMEAWIYFKMFPFWCFQPNFCSHPGSGPRHLWDMPTFPFS